MDWRNDIVTAVAVQQACMRVDVNELWEYSLPELQASKKDVVHAEKRLGFRLPSQYRSFLLYANGWRNFYESVGIFGTADLLGGELHDHAETLRDVTKDVFSPADYDLDDFFPIAASMKQIDLFVMGKVGSKWDGRVLWIVDDSIDEYESFLDCFRSLVEYDKMEAERLAKANGIEGEPRFVIPTFDE